MRRVILFICTLFLFAIPCEAKSGDVIGSIYSTDILTYVNDTLVEGFNIGGKTSIVIEDIQKSCSGFTYNYNDEERLLTATGIWYKNYNFSRDLNIKRGTPGKVVGKIYDTDIKVILNGSEVKGYNIGGKTAILIEDIGTVTENANEQYGYSKYLCNFNWNNDDRTVRLNFVDGYTVAYGTDPLAISIPMINFTAKDNIWVANYDPFNEFFSNIYSDEYTEEYLAETFVLKPLYFEVNGKKYEAGLCFTTDRRYDEILIKSPEVAYNILKPLVTAPVSSEEALKLLSDGVKFETLDSIETEDFFFLVVLDKEKEDELYNQIYYIAVKKTGGYAKISTSSSHYTTRELKKTGINKIYVTVSPFAGPHGSTTMGTEFDLNNYIFW